MTALSKGLNDMSFHRDRIEQPGKYPFNIPALRGLTRLKFHPAVTYLSGENGMGKSTLIEAIAIVCGFNPEGGSKNFNFNTRSSHSALHEYITVGRGRKHKDGYFLRSESFFNVATNIEKLDEEPSFGGKLIDSYGGKSLHEQSHGESFWALFMNRFRGDGLYILDEPEAALSPSRQMAMLTRMHELIRQGSQFIIATHSPIVMAYPGSIIYELQENGIRQCSYTETENYKVTAGFINNHEQMVRILLEDE